MTVSTRIVTPSRAPQSGVALDNIVTDLDAAWMAQTDQPRTALNHNTDLLLRVAELGLTFADACGVLDRAWEYTRPQSYVDDYRTEDDDGEYIEVRVDRDALTLTGIGDTRRPFIVIQFTA